MFTQTVICFGLCWGLGLQSSSHQMPCPPELEKTYTQFEECYSLDAFLDELAEDRDPSLIPCLASALERYQQRYLSGVESNGNVCIGVTEAHLNQYLDEVETELQNVPEDLLLTILRSYLLSETSSFVEYAEPQVLKEDRVVRIVLPGGAKPQRVLEELQDSLPYQLEFGDQLDETVSPFSFTVKVWSYQDYFKVLLHISAYGSAGYEFANLQKHGDNFKFIYQGWEEPPEQ